MPSGYVRVKAPDTVVLQVGAFSPSSWTIAPMTGPVTAYRVNTDAGIDTVIFASNRSDVKAQVDVKVQLSDGENQATTFVKVPAFGSVEIPVSQFFS